MIVAAPEKIASSSYTVLFPLLTSIAFQMLTGIRAQWTKSRETKWPYLRAPDEPLGCVDG